ncbi:hypothetical protein [Moorena producens]|uniref:hypothetical protein n=1 Tax=Moorena producens TaxID=1155739 RepID=UPI001313E17D|nr:hypothetical protein [Moorena producens]
MAIGAQVFPNSRSDYEVVRYGTGCPNTLARGGHSGPVLSRTLRNSSSDSRFPIPDSRFPFPSWEGLGVGSDSRFPIPMG